MRFSERDYASELGKNLLIYPLKAENIDSSSCDLTASRYAWKLSDQKSAVDNITITIPAKESVLIVTNETISLQKNLCGLCCSGVALATKGVITNTTPIKCGWIGKLILTVHNPTSEKVQIRVGDKIAVLLVDRLRSATKKGTQNTNRKTTELLYRQGIKLSDEEVTQINNDSCSDVQNLRERVKQEQSYIQFRNRRRFKYFWYLVAVGLAVIAGVLAAQFFEAKEFVPALVVAFISAVAAVIGRKVKVLLE